MESRQENIAREDELDERINQMLSGKGETNAPQTRGEQVAREFTRLAAEESPRMSSGARARGLEALRARAGQKHAARRPSPLAFLQNVPRWAQIGAVALVVVVLVNGVSIAAADALPGSLLYPFKRITEGGQLLLQNSNGQRARLWMNLANTRLDELQRLLNSGVQVNPSALDAVDESILRALTELAGTRGEERIALLQNLTALAIRQQQILQQMAQIASPADRARLEQTERLLQGVANYASSPDAVSGSELSPLQFLTPAIAPALTPTPTPAHTITPLPTLTPTAQPSFTPAPALTIAPASDNSGKAGANSSDNAKGDVNAAADANADDNGTSNGNDNGGDNTGSGNSDGNGDGGDNNGADDGDHDNSGSGDDNDNGGGGDGNGDGGQDNGGNDNSDNDNNGNGGGGQDDEDKGDNDNDNRGGGGGDNDNDDKDKDDKDKDKDKDKDDKGD